MRTLDELCSAVSQEVDTVSDLSAKDLFESLLIEPIAMRCAWDYGEPGETYDCWKVARHPGVAVAIVHCERGFGPQLPFGLVSDREDVPSMGMDSGWFSTLREAAADVLDVSPILFNV